jgi:HEAT repeat protein
MRIILTLTMLMICFGAVLADSETSTRSPRQWVDQLGDRYLDAREEAAQHLLEMGEEAVPLLIEAVEGESLRIRLSAVELLGRMKAAEARDVLLDLIWDERHPAIRRAAVHAIFELGPEVVESLESIQENPAVILLRRNLSEAVDRLSDTNEAARTQAEAVILRGGPLAEQILIERLADSEEAGKLNIIAILGRMRSERAVPALVEQLRSMDEVNVDAIATALEQIGDAALAHLSSLELEQGTPFAAKVKQVLGRELQRKVELFLLEQAGPYGGWGFYKDQFKPLLDFGREDVSPILLRYFMSNNHAIFIVGPGEIDERDLMSRRARIPGLAAEALAEVGGPSVIPALEKVAGQKGPGGGKKEEASYALWRLGVPKYYDQIVDDLQKSFEAAKGLAKFGPGSDLAILRIRREEYVKAQDIYRALINEAEDGTDLRLVYYNLACALALDKQLDESIEALRTSIDIGYTNLEWIQQDGDLANIKDHPAYRKLMEEAAADLGQKLDKPEKELPAVRGESY